MKNFSSHIFALVFAALPFSATAQTADFFKSSLEKVLSEKLSAGQPAQPANDSTVPAAPEPAPTKPMSKLEAIAAEQEARSKAAEQERAAAKAKFESDAPATLKALVAKIAAMDANTIAQTGCDKDPKKFDRGSPSDIARKTEAVREDLRTEFIGTVQAYARKSCERGLIDLSSFISVERAYIRGDTKSILRIRSNERSKRQVCEGLSFSAWIDTYYELLESKYGANSALAPQTLCARNALSLF